MMLRRSFSSLAFRVQKPSSFKASSLVARCSHGYGCSCLRRSFFSTAKTPEPAAEAKPQDSQATPAEPVAEAAKAAENTQQSAKETPVKKQTDEKDLKIAELSDAYRRLLADMENLRQRTRRDVESASQFAIQKFAKDLLDVADVLDMALASVQDFKTAAPEPSDPSTVKDVLAAEAPILRQRLVDLISGVSTTRAEMTSIFKRHGLEAYDPVGNKFDPNVHNALFEVPMQDKEPGHVVVVEKKGYMLNGRVVRPASVGLSKKA